MTNNVASIAYWFIKKADDHNKNIDQIKLIKLVYIAQGIALATGKKLFDDPIEAWKYGPVVPSLYHSFKHLGLNKITPNHSIMNEFSDAYDQGYFDNVTKSILEYTWDNFSRYTGIQLSNWSHSEDGPWYKEWEDNHGKNHQNHKMDDTLIAKYFSQFIDNNGNSSAK